MTTDHDMDGVQLFAGSQAGSPVERPPAGPSVFGAPAEGDILDRLDAVEQDDLGSDFFSHGTPAVDDQARAAFRESLAALADIEGRATRAAPARAPRVSAPAFAPTMVPTAMPAVDPVMPPVVAPHAAGTPITSASQLVPMQPSRLSPAERSHVLYGPRLTATQPAGVPA